jgi:hypothetical protein
MGTVPKIYQFLKKMLLLMYTNHRQILAIFRYQK